MKYGFICKVEDKLSQEYVLKRINNIYDGEKDIRKLLDYLRECEDKDEIENIKETIIFEFQIHNLDLYSRW